jgi:MSHA biogenesis protein MshI
LLGLFSRKRRDRGGLTGVEIAPGGLALVHVDRLDDRAQPRLKTCEFVAGNHGGAALQGLVRSHGLAQTRCVLSLHPSQYTIALIERPAVDDDELPAALRWRIKDLIDYPPEEAIIDTLPAAAGSAEHDANQVTVVIMRRALAAELHRTLVDAGLQPVAFDIRELCQRNISELLPESERGLIVLQLSQDRIHVYGFHAGELLLGRRIAMRGDELASELAARGDHPEESGALERTTVEIQRTLDFYLNRARRGHPACLLVVPFVSELPGLCTHLTQMVDLPCRPLDLNVLLEAQGALPDTLQAATINALGAALRRPAEVSS